MARYAASMKNTWLLVPVAAIVCTLPGCTNKVTLENYEKVQVGMTQGQVEGILGKGEVGTSVGMSISGAGVAGSSGGSVAVYTWKNKNLEISVTYKDGKVLMKSHS